MKNLIIHEENNNLIIKESYSPLVCGNTNYKLEFVFSEDWSSLTNKIAIFIVDGKKTAVEFEGTIVSVPAMPNANTCQVLLMSSESENTRLVTSVLTISLMSTILLEKIPEFSPLSNYVEEMLTKIKALQNGTLQIESSKHAETAGNVSNPNLLINGDFKVNQRGNTTYTEAGKYTVDRWKLVSGSVTVQDTGILLNGTIIQKLEHTPSMQVVASSNAGSITYKNGTVTISTTTATLITFAKLEVGTTATTFSPRTYAEELALCQRYFQSISTNVKYGTLAIGGCVLKSIVDNVTMYNFVFNLPLACPMRINPSVTLKSTLTILCKGAYTAGVSLDDTTLTLGYTSNYKTISIKKDLNFDPIGLFATLRSDDTNASSPAEIFLDSEIY